MSRRTTILALIALAAAPCGAAAQSLRYTSTSKMELAGAAGRMMAMMPGVGDAVETVTSIKGSRMRQDSDHSSTIIDWSTGEMTILDHAEHTWTRMNFQDMMDRMSEAMDQADAQDPEEGEAAEPRYDITFSADRTGKQDEVAGYDAEQVILTTLLEPKEEAAASGDVPPTTLAVVSELWLSRDFPGYRMMQEMAGDAAEKWQKSAAQGAAASMAMLSGFDPRLPEAAARNAEELRKLDGQALRSTMQFVMVPVGAELDREQVLAGSGESLGGGAGAGAADAAKKALGGLAGRFGRGKKEEPAKEAASQSVFMRMTSEITDVSTEEVDASIFEIPAGYTERKMEGVGAR